MSTQAPAVSLIGVGVDGYPEGRDAAALGTAIARATEAEVLLVTVHPDPLVVLPSGMNWSGLEEQARGTLIEVRDAISPGARIAVETDGSVARALHRVVRRENRDLLVLGSSRHAPKGQVRIGKRVRQLLCHFECALGVAPRGLHELASVPLGRVAVGYDASPEAEVALALAGSLAVAAGARLYLRGVVDDRLLRFGFTSLAGGGAHSPVWEDSIAEEDRGARGEARRSGVRVRQRGDTHRGHARPARQHTARPLAARWICSSSGQGIGARPSACCSGAPARRFSTTPPARSSPFRGRPPEPVPGGPLSRTPASRPRNAQSLGRRLASGCIRGRSQRARRSRAPGRAGRPRPGPPPPPRCHGERSAWCPASRPSPRRATVRRGRGCWDAVAVHGSISPLPLSYTVRCS